MGVMGHDFSRRKRLQSICHFHLDFRIVHTRKDNPCPPKKEQSENVEEQATVVKVVARFEAPVAAGNRIRKLRWSDILEELGIVANFRELLVATTAQDDHRVGVLAHRLHHHFCWVVTPAGQT